MASSLLFCDHVTVNLASRIGTHPRKGDSYEEIHHLGARWARFGWAVMLDRICSAGPGKYDFENNGQSLINGPTSAGLSVLAILDGRWGWEGDCSNLIPWASPIWDHWDVWDDYVYRTVERYKDRVKYWEMGNEPPQRYFWFPSERGVRPDGGEISPSYQALQALHRHVGEGRLLKAQDFDGAAHVYVFDGPDGPASILWGTAASRGRLIGDIPPATDAFGAAARLSSEWDIDMRPLLIEGDLLDGSFEASRSGESFILVTQPLHKPDRSTPSAKIPQAPRLLSESPGLWEEIPFLCRANPSQRPAATPTFMQSHSSAEGSLRLAWDPGFLYFESEIEGALDDKGQPRGILQFTLRDSAPEEYGDTKNGLLESEGFAHWKTIDRGRFFNGASLLSIECGKRGGRLFRSESLSSRSYPTGIIRSAHISHSIQNGKLTIRAAIPWKEIGPCQPGTAEPFLFMAAFGIADGPLDVPDEGDPMDWHQNYQHGFIVKSPSEKRWLFLKASRMVPGATPEQIETSL